MSCPARLGAFAAVSLVLLRLATGWHFFQEGTTKLNDPSWSSASFLQQAKGPLADFYHSKVPQAHGWQTLLAVPREAGFIDEERLENHRQWQEAHAKEIREAREAGEPEPFKVSEYKPYAAWADQILADWEYTLEQFYELPELTDEEKEQASEALEEARLQLVNYLDEVEPEISEFQHELFRIEQMEKQGATGNLAYHDERIEAKRNEAMQMAQPWIAEVAAIEEGYHEALRRIYYAGQEEREARRAEAAAVAETASKGAAEGSGVPAEDPAPTDEAASSDATEANDEPAAEGASDGATAVVAEEPADELPAVSAEQGAADSAAESEDESAEESTDEAPDAEGAAEPSPDSASEPEGLPPGPEAPTAAGEGSDADAAEAAEPVDETAEAAEENSVSEESADADAEQPAASAAEPAEAAAPAEPVEPAGEPATESEAVEAVRAQERVADAAAAPAEEPAVEEEPVTIQEVLTDSRRAELALVDKVVTWSHVIIGACLILGLFTPIAALGGAIFLAMVISTQPPWVPGAQDTYYQFVEMFGLLVLAATCAGRWAGLDYFFACLLGKCRRS